jgi:hypothetical protein
MKLAIITTLRSNSGDNFIYEGFKNLLPAKSFDSIFLIDKVDIPKSNLYKEFIDASDLIVICGSPIFYDKCYRMKWQNNLLEYSKKTNKKILLLAVGSNFKTTIDGLVFFPDVIQDENYKKFISRYNEISFSDFTVRDRYCLEFLTKAGFSNVKQIICPSIFAGNIDENKEERDLIFIIWGGTYWNSDIPSQKVLEICKGVEKSLSSSTNKKIIWVCHDFESYKELIKHTNKNNTLFSNNYTDFFKYYTRCFFAFSVKVHGTMLLASMGVPSLLLQLDSRAGIIEQLNENYATLSTPIEQLTDMCLEKIRETDIYREKIIALKSKYRQEYDLMLSRLGLI